MHHVITLPWPDRDLHPNARVHWARKARATKKARGDAKVACLAAGVRGLNWSAANVSLTFCPPDKRHRDADGMLAAMKGALDGVSDAIGIDDSRWSLELERGHVTPNGAVLVLITPSIAEGRKGEG